jgi:hypothetical protein
MEIHVHVVFRMLGYPDVLRIYCENGWEADSKVSNEK